MRLLKDDFHVIKRNGLHFASNCYEAKPEESLYVSIDLFCNRRERSCWQNLTYCQYQLSKPAALLYYVTHQVNPQSLKIDFFSETLTDWTHNVGKDRAHRVEVSSCNNPKVWGSHRDGPKNFRLWPSFIDEADDHLSWRWWSWWSPFLIDADDHLSYHTDKHKRKRLFLLLLVVNEAEETRGFPPLDKTEEDHLRSLPRGHWSAEVPTPGAGVDAEPYNCWQWALLPLLKRLVWVLERTSGEGGTSGGTASLQKLPWSPGSQLFINSSSVSKKKHSALT